VLLKALDSGKPMIMVVHYRLSDIDIVSRLKAARKITVTIDNRDNLRKNVPESILKELRSVLQF
ncbi:MAG: nucleoside-triphosphatase, partial [Desulfurococcaceae archaeon]